MRGSDGRRRPRSSEALRSDGYDAEELDELGKATKEEERKFKSKSDMFRKGHCPFLVVPECRRLVRLPGNTSRSGSGCDTTRRCHFRESGIEGHDVYLSTIRKSIEAGRAENMNIINKRSRMRVNTTGRALIYSGGIYGAMRRASVGVKKVKADLRG